MPFLTSVHVPSCFYVSADTWGCALVLSLEGVKAPLLLRKSWMYGHDSTHHRRRAYAPAGQRRARAAGQDTDPLPVVRLFTPDAHATAAGFARPADGDTAHGLIDWGLVCLRWAL